MADPADFEDDHTHIRGVPGITAPLLNENESAYLIVISGRMVGRMFKIGARELVIGRSDEAQIILDDEGVSRKHAKVLRGIDGSVRLVDLQSTNGTYCDGIRIDSHILRDGEKIQIGNATILKFSYQDDVDEAFQRQLYENATRDDLTKIYNKKFFLERLGQEVAYALRHSLPLGLILFDIDLFKVVNDTHGHLAGDFVLAKLASVIAETVRGEDVFARFGGEEFGLILRETPEEKGLLLAERLRKLVAATDFTFEKLQIPITISLGLAGLVQGELAGPDALIAAADRYLYAAKQNGRNRVESRPAAGG